MNFEDDNPFQIIYLPDNAINNAKEAKTITLPHQGIATHPTISSDLRKNEANTIPDTNNHSPLQSPIVSNEIRPKSEETSLNKFLAARRPCVINCSFPLRHFHYSFPFNFFFCSIHSGEKSVTLCDTSVTESCHMSNIIWLGAWGNRCTDH